MDEAGRKIIKKKSKIEKPSKSEKLERLFMELERLVGQNFTGYVKVNYSQGSIGRVEKFEEILKHPKEKDR